MVQNVFLLNVFSLILGPLPSATIDFHHLMAMECQNSNIHFLAKQRCTAFNFTNF